MLYNTSQTTVHTSIDEIEVFIISCFAINWSLSKNHLKMWQRLRVYDVQIHTYCFIFYLVSVCTIENSIKAASSTLLPYSLHSELAWIDYLIHRQQYMYHVSAYYAIICTCLSSISIAWLMSKRLYTSCSESAVVHKLTCCSGYKDELQLLDCLIYVAVNLLSVKNIIQHYRSHFNDIMATPRKPAR